MANAKTKSTRKGNTLMSSTNEALAALGLTDEASAPVSAPVAADTSSEAAATAEREEVEIGEIESGFLDFIPTMKRGGGAGSKYKFDTLEAPKTDENGKVKYAFHKISLQEGVEELKLKRSVQSATTQANRQYKEEGKYFVTRTISKDGKFAGMYIIRTDAAPADGEEAAE